MNSYVKTSPRVTILPVGPSFPEAPRHFLQIQIYTEGQYGQPGILALISLSSTSAL